MSLSLPLSSLIISLSQWVLTGWSAVPGFIAKCVIKPTNVLVVSPFSAGCLLLWGRCWSPCPLMQRNLYFPYLSLQVGQCPFCHALFVLLMLHCARCELHLCCGWTGWKLGRRTLPNHPEVWLLSLGRLICVTNLGKHSSLKPWRTFSDMCFPSWFFMYRRSWLASCRLWWRFAESPGSCPPQNIQYA